MAQDNPILDMGLLNMMQPNKYIDPKFADKPLKLPGFYTGQTGLEGDMPPTDAMGNPIQSFVDANNRAQTDYQKQLSAYNANKPAQGTTLNSTPSIYGTSTPNLSQGIYSAAPAGGYGSMMATASDPSQYSAATQSAMAQHPGSIPLSAFAGGAGGNQNQQDAAGMAALMGLDPSRLNGMPQQQAQQPAAQGGPPPRPDLRQFYLNALANPGKVTTPGATTQPSNPLGQPSVLNSFLANNPGGQVGNQGFFSTLNKLRTA